MKEIKADETISNDDVVLLIGENIPGVTPIKIRKGDMLREEGYGGWKESYRWTQITYFGFVNVEPEDGKLKIEVIDCNKTLADAIRGKIMEEAQIAAKQGKEFNPFTMENPLGIRLSYNKDAKTNKYSAQFDPRIELTDEIKKLIKDQNFKISQFTKVMTDEESEKIAIMIKSYRDAATRDKNGGGKVLETSNLSSNNANLGNSRQTTQTSTQTQGQGNIKAQNDKEIGNLPQKQAIKSNNVNKAVEQHQQQQQQTAQASSVNETTGNDDDIPF
jgi:hypothetical protein